MKEKYLYLYSKYYCLVLCLLLAYSSVEAGTTDTLRISLLQAEKAFTDSNLLLLAAHYRVDAQKALIEQAQKWDNPTLNTDHAIAAAGKLFPYGYDAQGNYNGQYYIQVQQLIRTAGKRSKLVALATTNTAITELELKELLRTLRYQLHVTYYSLSNNLQLLALKQKQKNQITGLVLGMEAQYKLGNIALKELLRVQGLQVSVDQDIANIQKDIQANQSDLRILFRSSNDYFYYPDEPVTTSITNTSTPKLDTLLQTAQQNNTAYLIEQKQLVFQEQNLAYQKSLRVPNLTVSPNFDRNANFAQNYWGLGFSLPIPLFNKNQGNIKSADWVVKQQKVEVEESLLILTNNIKTSLAAFQLSKEQIKKIPTDFYKKYTDVYQKSILSYQDKQIGLLEFIDFFTDYSASEERRITQQTNYLIARSTLNYQIGVDIIK